MIQDNGILEHDTILNYTDFEELRQVFYKERTKVIPKSIVDIFDSPITLAVWYMDDGKLDFRSKSHYAYHISTDSFTESEVKILQELLLQRFGIVFNVYMSLCRGKRYPKLYIGKEGRDVFYKTISPFILDCFRYKMPPEYSLTPQRLHAELPKT